MLVKRIIPCLDVDNGRVVKGKKFIDLIDAGDPVTLGKYYSLEGADELTYLDITASWEERKALLNLIEKIARQVSIPFTVGGGIQTVGDIRSILLAGADKISINSAAVKNPSLISNAANIFGSQCVVVAIDVKKIGNKWMVFVKGGRENTGISVMTWVKQIISLGAGEILLTSMNTDGMKKGFDSALTKAVAAAASIPVIASGGAGSYEDFYEIFQEGKADAALAASIFHFGEYKIADVKKYLQTRNILVRD